MSIKGLEKIEQFIKELNQFEKKQLPFATSKALNKTAVIAQRDMANKIAATYATSNSWYMPNRKYGVKKKNSTKKNTSLVIFMDRSNKEHWIEDHERGDTRSNQLVPTGYFKRMYGTGNAKTKRKAKLLLKNKSKNRIFKIGNVIYQAGIRGSVKRKKDYKSNAKIKGITKRKVINRKAVPLFIIAKTIKEKATLKFEETVTNSFKKNYEQIFYNEFNWAMFNAK